MKRTPMISIVIAAFNSRRTIEKCLRSIQNQSYPNIEIVVVDSKFYDKKEQKKCKRIIEKYAKYFQDGPERSIQRNRGIKEAKGNYILVIDQDMYLTPNVVKDCLKTYKSDHYSALTIPEISIGKGFWTQAVALERYVSIYLEKGINECCRFFKKKDAQKVGMYDPTIVGAEDSDFHYKMASLAPIGKSKEVIHHDEGFIRLWDRVKKKYYYSRAFRKYIKRYPTISTQQFFPIKPAYFKHWREFVKKPLVTLGIIILRSLETLAGLMGLVLRR